MGRIHTYSAPRRTALRYGTDGNPSSLLASVIEQAELRSVLERLPDGLQTPLGEAGGLVSGGEGQRVWFGRALLRSGVRLVILDEPFRGLDRARRHEILARARRLWQEATLLCITHDVDATRTFNRVLVVEAGRIVDARSRPLDCQSTGSLCAHDLCGLAPAPAFSTRATPRPAWFHLWFDG